MSAVPGPETSWTALGYSVPSPPALRTTVACLMYPALPAFSASIGRFGYSTVRRA